VLLRAFGSVTSPRQLYGHATLWRIYFALSAKGQGTVAALSLECLSAYSPAWLTPYRRQARHTLQ
jgi:hypothetical protein